MPEMVAHLASYIDHTLLSPNATEEDVARICAEAACHGFASVCIAPCHVPRAASILGDTPVSVGTVVGFPLGFNTSATKIREAVEAVEQGAKEIDMVINRGWVKSGQYSAVVREVQEVVRAVPNMVVKVIMELCDLTESEKREVAEALLDSGAHFLKTSTGFGEAGATLEDVALLAQIARKRMRIKAAGGIRDVSQALAFIHAGASRIGTSSGAAIVEECSGRSLP